MGYRQLGNAVVAGLVLAALIAPAAHADSGPWIRWKQGYRDPRVTRQIEYRRYGHGDGAGPAIAGFIGGLLVGSQLHSQTDCPPPVRERVIYAPPPPPCPPPTCRRYDIYDPEDGEWYSSLDECASRARFRDGPRFVVELDAQTGYCWDTFRWCDDNWHSLGRDASWDGCGGRFGNSDGRSYNRGGYDDGPGRNGRGHAYGHYKQNGRWNDDEDSD